MGSTIHKQRSVIPPLGPYDGLEGLLRTRPTDPSAQNPEPSCQPISFLIARNGRVETQRPRT